MKNYNGLAVDTKEEIKSNMLRSISTFWDASDVNLGAFDPIVVLLIEACANEIYKINHEIKNSQVKVLQKLANLLTPEALIGPYPAHGVLYAKPNDPELITYPTLQFFAQKKMLSRNSGSEIIKDIFFTPLLKFRLIDGEVKYMASGSKLYALNGGLGKDLFSKSTSGKKIDPYTVWMGLNLRAGVTDLNGLSFFFDWRNQPEKARYLNDLVSVKIYLDDKELATVPGFCIPPSNEGTGGTPPELDTMSNIEKGIKKLYENRYVSVNSKKGDDSPVLADLKKQYPEVFRNVFPEKELEKIPGPMLWLKIVFPPVFNETLLDEISVNINALPVINRRFNELRYYLQSTVNIIPFNCDNQFLAVKGVFSNDGMQYTSSSSYNVASEDSGIYAVREGGIERFDERNATEFLDYLVELLKDESSAFAAFGQDFIASLTKDLNQNIALIEQKIRQSSNGIGDVPTYLLIKPFENNDNIFIEYWSCDGETANGFRLGTKADLYSGADISRAGLQFITQVAGGRDKPNQDKVLKTYKNAMLTHGRVITVEDIKSTCWEVLGDNMKKVEIRKGVAPGTLTVEGLQKTLDVHITPATVNGPEWDDQARQVQSVLESRSPLYYIYRVFVEE